MADVKLLAPKILNWEGGFVNDPIDHGGATNKGITISTFKAVGFDNDGDGDIDVNDLKQLTIEQFTAILKKNYWDRWKADEIYNQSLADILVDWVWGSGKWGIIIPQRILGLPEDGLVGPKTIAALHTANAESLFHTIYQERTNFLNNIVARDATQARFIKGWLNRLSDFKFYP
jgi:lysozyme family protein